MLFLPQLNLPRQYSPNVRGRWLAHTKMTRAERASVAARLVLGKAHLTEPTITQAAELLNVPVWLVSEVVAVLRAREEKVSVAKAAFRAREAAVDGAERFRAEMTGTA